MPRYYTYLISSLPMLHFGMKPPFTYEKFIQSCERFVSEKEAALLAGIPHTIEYPYKGITESTQDKWYEFDRDVRNELVRIRASRKKIDPLKYLRPDDGYVEPYITHIVLHAHRNPSVLETEKILDQERWNRLEDIAMGHFFDFDFLMVYAFKLLILLRWENIRLADKRSLLENAIKTIEEPVT